MKLSEIESARLRAARELSNYDSESKSAAIGGLAGTVVGAGRGYFSKQKDAHDAAEEAKVDESRNARFAASIQNTQAGRRWDAELPDTYQPRPFDALEDLQKTLVELGWM